MMHGIFFIIAIVRKFKNCISRLAKCWFDANGIKRLGGLHKSFPYRKALEDLRDIRRHLRVQRPPESEIDVGMSNVIDGGRDWIDREGEEDCDCGGIDLTPVQRRRAKEREKRIEARLKRKFSRQDKKKKSHPHCNLGIYLSPIISIPLCLSVSVSLYVCLFHAFSWYTYKPFSFFLSFNLETIFTIFPQPENMNCFTHDNHHWKTPPYWTYGPFCFCSNANNNTYWCVRTINTTHDFVYCEFITTFMSYYDLLTGKCYIVIIFLITFTTFQYLFSDFLTPSVSHTHRSPPTQQHSDSSQLWGYPAATWLSEETQGLLGC